MSNRLLTDPLRQDLKHAAICWLATASDEGEPCLAPKTAFIADGDLVLIGDAPGVECVGNIRVNGRICISFISALTGAGYKIFGEAEVLDAGDPGFAGLEEVLSRKVPSDHGYQTIIAVTPNKTLPVPMPVTQRHPHVTRMAMIEARYGHESI
jgi:hypothetical protein